MKTIRNILVGLVLILLQNTLEARHLSGGTMHYECLGNGDYEITLNIFRDANCRNCADFDNLAPIAIYKCAPGVNCTDLSQAQPLHSFYAPVQEVTLINADSTYECGSSVCDLPMQLIVEQGTYRFKLSDFNINLPDAPESYFINYQRCCLPDNITNIAFSDDQGFTISAEITPAAQTLCNSMPVLENFPSIYVRCANEPTEIKLQMKDADGDQLRYRVCSPVAGGGDILTTPGYNSCDGSQPNPPCPPPYKSINFAIPFSPQNPFETESGFSLNLNEGNLAFTPSSLGFYLAAICVDEYRNGVQISSQTISFQVAVASPCEFDAVVDKSLSKKIKLYPNPASEQIQLEMPDNFNPAWYSLKGVAGNQIIAVENYDKNKPIDVSFLSKGIYFLKLKSDKLTAAKRFIIE